MSNIDWNLVLPTRPASAFTWILAGLAALAGGGWALFSFGVSEGRESSKDRIAFLETSKEAVEKATDAKLPDLYKNLSSIVIDLKTGLKVYERNKELEGTISSYKEQVEGLSKTVVGRDSTILAIKSELEQSNSNQAALKAEIIKLSGESRKFFLATGHSEKLLAGYSVGLTDVNIYAHTGKVIYDNKQIDVVPGFKINVDTGNKRCFLTVLDLTDSLKVPFDFTCL